MVSCLDASSSWSQVLPHAGLHGVTGYTGSTGLSGMLSCQSIGLSWLVLAALSLVLAYFV